MLDGALALPAAAAEFWAQASASMHSEVVDHTLTQIFTGMFLPTDTVRKQEIIDGATSFPRHVAVGEWDAISTYDSTNDAAKCQVPALYVGSAAPIADVRRLKELMPHVMLAQTAGAGHFHQLEVPEQINAMIERFMLVNKL